MKSAWIISWKQSAVGARGMRLHEPLDRRHVGCDAFDLRPERGILPLHGGKRRLLALLVRLQVVNDGLLFLHRLDHHRHETRVVRW